MYNEYDFFTAPNVADFDALSKKYETDIKAAMRGGRQRILDGDAAATVSAELLDTFIK
jgi:hypothetical protein